MAKKAFNVRVEEDVLIDLERVANAAGMDRNDYGILILRRFSQLKLDFALDAITSIPKEYFKSHGGRPQSRPTDMAALQNGPALAR